MTHVLHINDNNLLIQAAAEGAGFERSHGYAWLKGDQVLFDVQPTQHAPVAHCRVAPQEINNRYWQQCAQTAIGKNGAGMRHAADLIWKHLAELKANHSLGEMAIVVPAHYRDTHLQLLLGVTKALELEVTALISKPVLASQQLLSDSGGAIHLDVQLHQTTVSTLQLANGVVSLVDVEIKSELGIHAMQEALLKSLQKNFIQSDRFDPLHDANTEQQLFDQLPSIVAGIQQAGKATVGVQHQGHLYSTSMNADELNVALSEFAAVLSSADSGAVKVMIDLNSAFGRAVPASLTRSQWLEVSDPKALTAEQQQGKRDGGGGVLFQTELPLSAPLTKVKPAMVAAPNVAKNTDTNQATHLMQMGVATPIDKARISTAKGVLRLTTGEQSNVSMLLKSGELTLANEQVCQSLKANDRLISPLADGIITAVKVL